MSNNLDYSPKSIGQSIGQSIEQSIEKLKVNLCEELAEMKALDIKVLEVSAITSVCDFFIIATGTSQTHINAIAENIATSLKKQGIDRPALEGQKDKTWIVLDYKDIVVHIMLAETRSYYNLEELWYIPNNN